MRNDDTITLRFCKQKDKDRLGAIIKARIKNTPYMHDLCAWKVFDHRELGGIFEFHLKLL